MWECRHEHDDISLPEALQSFVDEQVATQGYDTSSEYVRELVHREQDRRRLRALLLEGAESAPGPLADRAFFDRLRERLSRLAADEPAFRR